MSYTQSEEDEHVAALKLADLAYVCDERERAILRLHLNSTALERRCSMLQTACDERLDVIHRLDGHVRDLSRQRDDLARQRNDLAHVAEAELQWSVKRPVRFAKRAVRRALAALKFGHASRA